ncbi:MAG: isoleucine--tRNA ligase, partial [Alphaproteobacteria bacterium]|nr:isoleucine--tRNA ligase [Alphaproteobacteria bacterium]
SRFPSDDDSVHLRSFPEIPDAWEDAALARRWGTIRDIRRVVTGALVVERAVKRIGSSLEARPVVHGPVEMLAAFEGIDAAELFITSGAELVPGAAPDGAFALPEHPGIGVTPAPAGGGKCARCWKVLDEVGQAQPDDVCHRCADALRAMAG